MTQYWFKPKTHGYGATPSNWKGWAATGAFIGLILVGTLLLLPWQPKGASGPAAWEFGVWAGAVAVLTLAFIAFAKAKTDGQWRWRWGK
jgi:hypothetical protein